MPSISMKELLEAGVHFGHRTNRWNPKMKRYIYGGRNGIYIIDLHQTLKLFEDARAFIQSVAEDNKPILFVGTKKQAQEAVEDAARKCRQYWVNQRWLGGMLTNYRTIKDRIQRLRDLETMEADGSFEKFNKKEASLLREEKDRLERYLGGIKDMPELPGAVFIVDLKKEHIAVQEARKLEIPVVAIVDTNCDPDEVDLVIPGNDDAIRAIKLMCQKMSEAIIEVKQIEWQGAEVVEDGEDISQVEASEEESVVTAEDAAVFSASPDGHEGEGPAAATASELTAVGVAQAEPVTSSEDTSAGAADISADGDSAEA
ncbi:MAG: 30S ribosomal protein S2 [Armatimonadetes bacterium]|nr:30S ribosomal protein S2 [Armatimonadota bacterium]